MSEQAAPPPTKQLWAETIRLVAIILVVLLHVAAPILYKWGKVPADWWTTANFYLAPARMCVPLFVMLSGALLLGKREPYRAFARKRLWKVCLPWGCWAVGYLGWDAWLQHKPLVVGEALARLVEGPVYYHLWYFYMLVGLYLITPVLRLFVERAAKRDLLYLVGLWFVVTALASLAKKLWGLELGLELPAATGFIGYYVLGYLLAPWRPSRKLLWVAVLVVFAGTALTIGGTEFLTQRADKFDSFWYGYTRPQMVAMSAGLFVLLASGGRWLADRAPASVIKVILLGGRASFGVYLLHVIVLDALKHGKLGFYLSGAHDHAALMIPLTAIVALAASTAVVLLVQRIPLLRRLVP